MLAVLSIHLLLIFAALSSSEEDEDNESESQTSSTPNTSALETLVRTACESLAVSTLLAGTSSASINPLNAPGQQMSKDTSVAQPHGDSGSAEVAGSSVSSNLYAASTSTLSSADEAVFSVIFGHGREQNVTEDTVDEQSSLSASKELDLTQGNLSNIVDAEVVLNCAYSCDL